MGKSWHGYSLASKRMGPNNQYESTWTDGNGAGSEKFDYFDHLGEETRNSDKFHAHARVPWLTASNQKDSEPKPHPMGKNWHGYNFIAKGMGPNNQYESTWTDGNGAGSEKMDYFEHLSNEVKNTPKFHKEASAPWLTASN